VTGVQTCALPISAAFLGTYLLAAQFLAIGLFCSSLTRVQIGSAIMSFVVLMGLFFLWRVARDSASTAAKVLQYISPPWHMVGFLKGVIDTRDLVYFVASTALFLFLSAKVLESRRWR
jgi:ABC-2 type transport system permease protein